MATVLDGRLPARIWPMASTGRDPIEGWGSARLKYWLTDAEQ
jgi:hypothetical protein